jgi:hypothetical protein
MGNQKAIPNPKCEIEIGISRIQREETAFSKMTFGGGLIINC